MHQCFPIVRWLPIQAIFSVVAALLPCVIGQHTSHAAGFNPGSPMAISRSYHSVTLLGSGKVLVTGGYGNGYLNSAELYDPATNSFTPAAALASPRHYHTATPLPNGKVLIAGGSIDGTDYFATTELYDPANNTFTAGASMSIARNSHTATLLKNGKVLIAGGYNGMQTISTAEIYDPSTNTFTSASNAMASARQSHTATLLANGTVLIIGGFSGSGAIASAEIYDPATNGFSPASSMSTGRYYHTSTLLADGKILVAGGSSDAAILQSAELYDPGTGSFTATGIPTSRRYFHSANLLPNGKVLLAGGRSGTTILNSAEVYDPATNSFSPGSNMLSARYLHAAIMLTNGKIFVTGGSNVTGALRLTEFYDSSTNSFATIGDLVVSRTEHAAVILPDGKILLAGGGTGSEPMASAEIFDPSTLVSQAVAPLTTPRRDFTATLLPNGKVLFAGGDSGSGTLSSAELFDPAAGSFAPLPSMTVPRSNHTATLLKDGKVLLAGGLDGEAPLTATELFDPALNAFVPGTPMAAARHSHTATVLKNGNVLIAGGTNSEALGSAEIYDPTTRLFQAASGMTAPREGHAATILPSGKVLVTGGMNSGGYLNSAEVFDTTAGFSSTGSMAAQRHNHRALLLHNGTVLVTGGRNGAGALNTAEIFDPAINSFTMAAVMTSPRESHSASPLPDAKVLIAGGTNGTALASAEIFTLVPATAEAGRPEISTLSLSEESPSKLSLTGIRFAGYLESSGGSSNNAPANLPLLQLRGVESGITSFVLSDSLHSWSDTSFSSASIYGLPIGFYRASLITGSIPSVGKTVRIAPVATAEPTAVDFSGISISRTSPPQPITTRNSGSTDLLFTGAALVGTDAAMFTLDSATGCGVGTLLAENMGCDLQVTFHPSSTGTKEAVVEIFTNDPDRPALTVPLTGTGIIVTYPLTIVSTGTGSGRIDLSTGGSCTGNCSESIIDGSTVTLTPVADVGSQFTGWSGCDSVTGTTCTVAVTEAKTVSAAFNGTYPLTVQYGGTGSGTVTFSSGGECTGTCTRDLLATTVVTLTAVTGGTSYFDGWSGCDSAEGTTCTVAMNAARNVDVFFRSTYPLTVTVTGSTGGGTVTLPSGTSCTGTCTETFNEGTMVSLTAVPAAGYYVGSWAGCDSVSGTVCTVTISSVRNVTARFDTTPILSLGFSGTGTGTVTMAPGETCTGNCSKAYPTGTNVTLTPAAAAGSLFSGWTGCDYTTGDTCTVTMTSTRNVTATFAAGYPLAVGISGSGTVTLDPGGTCAVACNKQYSTGATVSLTPNPIGSASFLGWTGCDSVSGTTCTVTMTAAKNVTAAFTSSFQLYLTVSGPGTGRFDFSGGESCTGSCFKTFNSGTTVTITPQLSEGVLERWTGCDQTSGDSCTVTMTGARNVTATLTLPIDIAGRIYGQMQDAYDSMASGEVMRMRAYDFVGDLNCNRSATVSIFGGYDRTYTCMTGQSSMRGTLTIQRGSVILDNLVIR